MDEKTCIDMLTPLLVESMLEGNLELGLFEDHKLPRGSEERHNCEQQLDLLVRDAGHVVAREALTRAALGRELTAFDRAIDTHVSNLRRKLGRDPTGRSPIRSIRGAGYQLATRRD